MKDYILEAIEQFKEDVSTPAHTPASKGLFDVDVKSPKLDTYKADIFHSIVAKLLYISSRARTDISTTIVFLCIRVSKSTEHGWHKQKRLLRYLKQTQDMEYILGYNKPVHIITWVDAAYAVHEDMQSHTGGCSSLGHGIFWQNQVNKNWTPKAPQRLNLWVQQSTFHMQSRQNRFSWHNDNLHNPTC